MPTDDRKAAAVQHQPDSPRAERLGLSKEQHLLASKVAENGILSAG